MAASRGICASGAHDPELWFPLSERSVAQIEMARGLCHACPVRFRCLTNALERGERDGIWGGTTPSERATMHPATKERIRREAAAEEAGERASLVPA